MYLPSKFKVDDLPALHAAIRKTGLATLITSNDAGLAANHLPLLLEGSEGKYGTLYGHLARANSAWSGAQPDALAIFMGPDGYISPSWYRTKDDTGEVVPTWNYVAIHARGPITFFDDADRLLSLVTRLTEKHEAGRAKPWAVSDAPAEYIARQLKAIVGFRLEIASLEGKWKMSQNRSAEDRRGVLAGLKADGAAAVADVMEGPGKLL
ncbi:MAG: FMN-binding negative transcriptional regulator [Rhodospirillaceae bacterium]